MRRNIAQANPDATVFYGPSPGKKNRSLRGGLLPPEKNLAKSLKFPPGEIGDLDPPPFRRSPDAHSRSPTPGQPVLQILQVRVVLLGFSPRPFSFPLLAQPLHLAYGETLAQRGLENRHETAGGRRQKRAGVPRGEPSVDDGLFHGGGGPGQAHRGP